MRPSSGAMEWPALPSPVVGLERLARVMGKVALKRNVDRLDEMALDTSSTKTTRVKK